LETDTGVRVYAECGPDAAWWPGNDSPWHQLGIEVVGRDGVAGLSLNHGWWYRCGDVQGSGAYSHDDEDPHSQATFLRSVLAAAGDGAEHPNAELSGHTFETVMAVQHSAAHGGWARVGEANDSDVALLRSRWSR
jgi:hypothetical protein